MLARLLNWLRNPTADAEASNRGYDYAAGSILRCQGPSERLQMEADGEYEIPCGYDHPFNQGMRHALRDFSRLLHNLLIRSTHGRFEKSEF